MPREYSRHERIAGLVQRGLAQLISTEVSDPCVAGLTVTQVRVSPDLRHANVFVTRMDQAGAGKLDDKALADIMQGVARAAGFLRRRLAQTMDAKRCPELHFEYDHAIQKAADLTALIDSLDTGRQEQS